VLFSTAFETSVLRRPTRSLTAGSRSSESIEARLTEDWLARLITNQFVAVTTVENLLHAIALAALGASATAKRSQLRKTWYRPVASILLEESSAAVIDLNHSELKSGWRPRDWSSPDGLRASLLKVAKCES
jgi:hypothetical protein